MARRVRVLVLGGDELKEKLRGLADKQAKQVIRGACREAMKLTQATAKALAPSKTGALRRSIRVRTLSARSKRIGARVTTSHKDNLFSGKTFYGAFQEWGWKTGSRKNTSAAAIRRIASQLRRESRKARGDGFGLAKRGTAFRARQEAFFQAEGARRATKIRIKERRQITGKYFMRDAARKTKTQAVASFRNAVSRHILKVLAK